MTKSNRGAYGADNDIVDYILGITFEIWEEGGVELIGQYYGKEAPIRGLDGIVRGASEVIDVTRGTLKAFPNRLLLADYVIWSGSRQEGYYTSHRVLSPMTNEGATVYGPATGRRVRVMNIADCVVEDGVITEEWLLRDNHALVTQLGFDPLRAASVMAGRRSHDTRRWMDAEIERLQTHGNPGSRLPAASPANGCAEFAARLISTLWTTGEVETVERAYAPYAVLNRSPVAAHSGRESIAEHYAGLRRAFDVEGVSVDHVAVQPFGSNAQSVAVRWAVAGRHTGEYLGLAATGKPVFVLGASHWRIVADRIAAEWTVFDGVGVLAQLV